MNWKQKARVQKLVAFLPEWLAMSCYYALQRSFGALRSIDPTSRLQAAIDTWDHIVSMGNDPRGKRFFEVGTGRMVNAPLGYWLMGAEQTITVDLNPYMKHELIQESLEYIDRHQQEISLLFGDRLIPERLDAACELANRRASLTEILSTLSIEYRSPADASQTQLPENSVDFHTSYTVFEHIPPDSLLSILREARRITSPSGLLVHGIDYSDHFSHNDSSINAIHFLRFDQGTWDGIAGNRFMYMNRLRHSQYIKTFEKAGLQVLRDEPQVDQRLAIEIQAGCIPLNESYRSFEAHDLATTEAWVISRSFNDAAMVA